MEQMKIMRLEINYFLSTLELIIGYENKNLAEEALNMLIIYFFTFENEEFCEDYIERLEDYITRISNLDDHELMLLKSNIPNIMNLISTIKNELPKC